MQNWEPWSACSTTCGAGTKSRSRKVFTDKANGGTACGLTTATKDCDAGACPVNCSTNQWSTWSTCTQDCGGGVSTRERTVATHATLDGYTCPHLTERKSCNTEFCAVDCVMGSWEAWSECTLSCGGGQKKRIRHPLHAAKFGGKVCGPSTASESCNSQACPVNCVMPAFSGAFSTCTKACGAGTQKRYRSPTTESANGGLPCKHFVETRPCQEKPCEVDCVLSAPESSQCSAACGTGHITTKRTVITAMAYGGKACGALVEYTECNTQPCPINCIQTAFSNWSSCSATCGGGEVKRTRRTIQQGAYGGPECPDEVETKQCGTDECPINCVMSGWSLYSGCTHSCGSGTQSRTRRIETQSNFGGAACGKTKEVKQCNTEACPVDCVLGAFGEWSACSLTCGGGKRTRYRSVMTAPQYTGKACAELRQVGDCKTASCPVDCNISVWTGWSACSTTCELGFKTSLRSIVSEPLFGGKSCASVAANTGGGGYSRRMDCNANSPCPIHCTVAEWGSWDPCPVTCGSGIQFRTRGIVLKAQHGGTCPSLKQQQSCNTDICAIDCQLNSWGSYGECSKSCNGGQRQRGRTIKVAPMHGGVPCGVLTSTQVCNNFYCPVDCEVSAWGSWDSCSVSCGGGITRSTKRTLTAPAYGGVACPAQMRSKDCATFDCAVDCVQSAWSEWSPCSEPCAGGESTRTRSTSRGVEFGGKICGDSSQTKTCNTHKCPVNCKLTEWMNEGSCTHSCGRGVQRVLRYVQVPSMYGGLECDSLREKAEECSTQACPIDCAFTWAGWTPCTKQCGGGTSTNTQQRTVLTAFGGKPCGAFTKTKTCNEHSCAVDCVMGSWGGWSGCSLTCGGGVTKRTRPINVNVAFGGAECDSGEQIESCNVDACPVDCVVGDWTEWSACTVSCGAAGGSKTRSRSNVAAQLGGVVCPTKNVEVESCNRTPCPEHCQVGGWTTWSACTKTCGGGSSVRSRSVIARADHGGYVCPSLDESRGCNTHACPTDCTMTQWSSYGECSVTCGGAVNADLSGNTGGGRRTRTRTIIAGETFGGVGCGATSENKGYCNVHDCPVDCQLSEWSAFSDCTNTCDEGTKTRSRQRIREAAHDGKVCDAPLVETVQCEGLPACPVDCELTSWTTWTTCTKTCNGGKQTRTRDVITPANDSGAACGPQNDSQDCKTQPCPINCVKADTWKPWTACSVTCGGGIRTRTKDIVTPASHGGHGCDSVGETETCGTNGCPIDCEMTQWSTYSACTKSCGNGSRTRERSVAVEVHFGGKACGHSAETTTCNDFACSVDCQQSDWFPWTTCNKDCGGGNMQRTKQVHVHPQFGGVACSPSFESKACNVQLCPIDCVEEGWGLWSKCTISCGGGYQTRSNPITTPAAHGGKPCHWQREQQQTCNRFPCAVDCVQSELSSFSECTATCGGGTQFQSRTTSVDTRYGGKKCLPAVITKACNEQACPIPCKVTAFSNWSACSVSCGSGTMERTRHALQWPNHGGKECPTMKLTATCQMGPCGVDCTMGAWSSWKACTKTCGGGVSTRVRTTIQEAADRGRQCPSLAESVPCNVEACPVNCVMNPWSDWQPCTAQCGGGRKTRVRTVRVSPDVDGNACPAKTETQNCNSHACAVDCVMSDWGSWGACSKSCGKSFKFQQRNIERVSENGGAKCGTVIKSQACTVPVCPLDCQLAGRGPFGACSKRCAGGTQSRPKFVRQYPVGTGMACPPLALEGAWTETQACNTQACPIERIEDHFDFLDACSHTKCIFHHTYGARNTKVAGVNTKSIKVLHHQSEQNGDRHVCKSKDSGDSCICKCWDKQTMTVAALKAKERTVAKKISAP
jgi:hypothetical protein